MPDAEAPQPYVSPYIAISEQLRALARELVQKDARLSDAQQTIERAAITALMRAVFDAVRAEWYDAAKNAGLEHELAVARKMMKDNGYDSEQDTVCAMPGAQPMVAMIDGKAAVCYEMSMAQILPLSAYYTNAVREAIEIAAQVGELVAAKEATEPEKPPGIA